MDPRTAPVSWLSHSMGEAPYDTLAVLEEATVKLLSGVDRPVDTAADVQW